MEKNFNNNHNQTTNEKLEKMRKILLDKDKCKEIAHKLSQYIVDSK